MKVNTFAQLVSSAKNLLIIAGVKLAASALAGGGGECIPKMDIARLGLGLSNILKFNGLNFLPGIASGWCHLFGKWERWSFYMWR